jgi:hypothetical protein
MVRFVARRGAIAPRHLSGDVVNWDAPHAAGESRHAPAATYVRPRRGFRQTALRRCCPFLNAVSGRPGASDRAPLTPSDESGRR